MDNLTIASNGTSCTGCSACLGRCPNQCITLHENSEGFLYPQINKVTCINCGLCEKVCHELHPYEARKPQQVFAAINKDEDIRLASSSGGIFYLLAKKTISEGGVVFGAKFDDNWQVYLTHAETMEDVKPFMGSKYVQARTANAYKDAKRFLKEGRKVMFSGTPCQIAGLRHFLGKDYDNLTTVDFVCHGVPSPKVWRMYLNEITTAGIRAISDIKFRSKRQGWKRFNFEISYAEDVKSVSLSAFHGDNHYMRAFLSDLILRPSCYNCKAKGGRSHSDITIADFWGIEKVFPNMDDDKGAGLLLINTEKGRNALNWEEIISAETDYERVTPLNSAIVHSAKPHPKRDSFFSKLDSALSVTQLIDHELLPPITLRIKITAYKRLQSTKQMIINLIRGGYPKSSQTTTQHLTTASLPPHIVSVNFRDKQKGWSAYSVKITMK